VLPIGDVVACGNGLTAYAAVFEGRPFAQNAQPALMPHAIHVARLACVALAQDHVLAPHDAQPLYLRNKIALTTLERLAKAAA
jgi:tRNA threonylcarbamoyladenosine biosynthesis protein TsaB